MTELIDRLLAIAETELRRCGCPAIGAMQLAIKAWPGPPAEGLLTTDQRAAFIELHRRACERLGEPPREPDLRPVRRLAPFEIAEVATRYAWSINGRISHTTELMELSANGLPPAPNERKSP